jgi:hypothetical protein
MKILQNKTKLLATTALLFVMSMSFGQGPPPDFNADWDNQPGGGDEEAPINDWIFLSSIIAIGYGFYAIKKKSAVKA